MTSTSQRLQQYLALIDYGLRARRMLGMPITSAGGRQALELQAIEGLKALGNWAAKAGSGVQGYRHAAGKASPVLKELAELAERADKLQQARDKAEKVGDRSSANSLKASE